jgi:8-oxo-dGTP diphosphatase
MNATFNPNDPRTLTRVAVVIIERIQNGAYEVLFAQRPEGKAYAGHWEFPGGKIEAGESVEVAAIREIEEELGVHIRSDARLEGRAARPRRPSVFMAAY